MAAREEIIELVTDAAKVGMILAVHFNVGLGSFIDNAPLFADLARHTRLMKFQCTDVGGKPLTFNALYPDQEFFKRWQFYPRAVSRMPLTCNGELKIVGAA
jgi:hypothetical protein